MCRLENFDGIVSTVVLTEQAVLRNPQSGQVLLIITKGKKFLYEYPSSTGPISLSGS